MNALTDYTSYPMLLAFVLLVTGCQPKASSPTVAGPRVLPESFLRGMTFAHEGYRGHNGYGGDLVGPSMDSLNRLGANAISVVPYTFMRGEGRVDSLPIPEHYGAENDSAVLGCIRKAHDRGLQVMLKPQIWVRGSWPGDIDYASEDDWAAQVSADFARRRAADLVQTGGMVDTLFRSLLADMVPAQALRAGGLWALKLAPALRRQAFNVGMGRR